MGGANVISGTRVVNGTPLILMQAIDNRATTAADRTQIRQTLRLKLACGFFKRGLKLQNPDLLEPVLDQRRPHRHWMFCAPQAEGVPALGKEMDLRRDVRIIKSPRINRSVADAVH